jgi:hypothetical protein
MDCLSKKQPGWLVKLICRLPNYGFLRVVLGLALLVAATFKGYQLANDTVPGTTVWNSRPFLVGLVLFELAFGLWLWTGLYPCLTRLAAIALCFAFFEASLYQVVAGQSTCGCMGQLDISPWWTMVFDGLALTALVFLPAPKWNEPPPRTAQLRLAVFAFGFVLLGLPGLLSMQYYSPRGLHLNLRRDPALQTALAGDLKKPSTAEILRRLQEATGLKMSLDSRLEALPTDFGQIKLGKAWGVMMFVAEKQPVASRWEKTDAGYALVQAAPWGNRSLPWLLSFVVLGTVLLLYGIRITTKHVLPKQGSASIRLPST